MKKILAILLGLSVVFFAFGLPNGLNTTNVAWNGIQRGAVTPTMASAAVSADGETVTITWSVSCSIGAGGSGGFTITPTAGAEGTLGDTDSPTITYSSGAPGITWTFTVGGRILNLSAVETFTVTYVQPGNGVEATSGGADVASYGPTAITNNSTAQTYFLRDNSDDENTTWGVGFELTANGLTGGWARSTIVDIGESPSHSTPYVPTRVAFLLIQQGSPDSRNCYAFVYAGANTNIVGPPDDRLGNISNLVPSDTLPTGTPAWFNFSLTGVGQLTVDDYYSFGLAVQTGPFPSPNYIGWRHQGFGGPANGVYGKESAPATPNDAANWIDTSGGGGTKGTYRIYSSPGNDDP